MADPISITIAAGSLVVSIISARSTWRQHRKANRPDVVVTLERTIAEPLMAAWAEMPVRPWPSTVRVANREDKAYLVRLTLLDPKGDGDGSFEDIGFLVGGEPGKPITKSCLRRVAPASNEWIGFKHGVTVVRESFVPSTCSRPGEPEEIAPPRGVQQTFEAPDELVMRVEIRRWSWSPAWVSVLPIRAELPSQRIQLPTTTHENNG